MIGVHISSLFELDLNSKRRRKIENMCQELIGAMVRKTK
jgi:hypothetical protein